MNTMFSMSKNLFSAKGLTSSPCNNDTVRGLYCSAQTYDYIRSISYQLIINLLRYSWLEIKTLVLKIYHFKGLVC